MMKKCKKLLAISIINKITFTDAAKKIVYNVSEGLYGEVAYLI